MAKSKEVRCPVCGTISTTRQIKFCTGTAQEPHPTTRCQPTSLDGARRATLPPAVYGRLYGGSRRG